MKTKPTVLLSALCLMLGPAVLAQVTTDLWDSHQGATIVSSSGDGPQPLVDMFGGVSPGPEPGSALFPDSFPIGYTQFVDWQSATPIALSGYHILANDDDAGVVGGRGFTAFRLYAFNTGTSSFDLVDTF